MYHLSTPKVFKKNYVDFVDSAYEDEQRQEIEEQEESIIPTSPQMRIKFPTLALACDRTGVSDKTAAVLVSAALKDLKVVTKEETNKVID
ncbi:hypothetical protein ILUMI_12664 [Ignelater luminosus]|uniref:Uncharacterized protein n=1 Tax=Ignelater luminosus TaxID=2038154 RepID=A0A8K0CTS4_IGNLU|nr:hypothetical protein ILUMI_12664 [Ignelater luminosus]